MRLKRTGGATTVVSTVVASVGILALLPVSAAAKTLPTLTYNANFNVMGAGAFAGAGTFEGGMNLWGSPVDFNQGGSKVYDDGNLHVATDDSLYLDAPDKVLVQNDLQVGQRLILSNNGVYSGSYLYDNGDLHLVADGSLRLDASAVKASGTLSAVGLITATGGVSGALTGNVTGNADTATALKNARTIGGTSFDGTANITVATATGGFTVSGGSLNIGTNALVSTMTTGTAPFTVASTTRVANLNVAKAGTADALTTARTIGGVSFDGSGNITVATATGGFTVSGGALALGANALTSTGSASFGTVTASGGVQSTAVAVTANTNGDGAAIIPAGTSYVSVTAGGGGATDKVTLPTFVAGNVIRLMVGATGYKLQAPASVAISGGTAAGTSSIAADTLVTCVATVTAASVDNWVCTSQVKAGTVAAVAASS